MTERTGSCLCGQVTYRVIGDPIASGACWCRACQHISANGTVNAVFPTAALEIDGNLSEFRRTGDSGNEVRRRFCAQCGSHLFANSSASPQFTTLRLGSLQDPSSIRPTVNIWASSAPAWACLDPAIERVEGQPALPSSPKAAT